MPRKSTKDAVPAKRPRFKFKVGDEVLKAGGYGFHGEVMAAYRNKKGEPRYVVEVTEKKFAGWQHIFNGDQLMHRNLP